jgi:hypothetical protein
MAALVAAAAAIARAVTADRLEQEPQAKVIMVLQYIMVVVGAAQAAVQEALALTEPAVMV